MKEMWDSRYAATDYVYGKLPNTFFREVITQLKPKGKLLMPAEGEGRNAVYAAKNGFKVQAFDISLQGKEKALKLAKEENVLIHYHLGMIKDINLDNESFDGAVLISAHFLPHLRKQTHHEIAKLIKPGGLVILEGFSKNNLKLREANPAIGGPDKIDMLFTKEGIQGDFENFSVLHLEEVETELNEGLLHKGQAKVIRFIGQKL